MSRDRSAQLRLALFHCVSAPIYRPPPMPPEFISVTPDRALSTGGTQLVIAGNNLKNGTVDIGGRAADIISTSDTAILLLAPVGEFNGGFPTNIDITTPGGHVQAPASITFDVGISLT